MLMNVLISSGRRIGLADCFRQSFSELGVKECIIAMHATAFSPAGQLADVWHQVADVLERSHGSSGLPVLRQEI